MLLLKCYKADISSVWLGNKDISHHNLTFHTLNNFSENNRDELIMKIMFICSSFGALDSIHFEFNIEPIQIQNVKMHTSHKTSPSLYSTHSGCRNISDHCEENIPVNPIHPHTSSYSPPFLWVKNIMTGCCSPPCPSPHQPTVATGTKRPLSLVE